MSTDARGSFDPFTTIVHLREDGRAVPVVWTPDVFSRLVTEMHPSGDELLYLLAGELDVLPEEPGSERPVGLRGGQACLVPRGVWHRLVLRQPSDLLFIAPAHGTEHRPAATARPARSDA